MSTSLLIVLSLVEAVALVVVLALALIEIRRRLTTISEGLATLASALTTVEAQHLRPLEGALQDVNDGVGALIGLLPSVAAKAKIVADHVSSR